MKRLFSILRIVFACVPVQIGLALAGTTTAGNFTVQVQIVNGCSIASPSNFVFATTLNTQAAPGGVTQSMSVTCSGVFITVYNLGFVSPNDKDATGTAKIMKGANPGNADTVPYNLKINGSVVGKQDGTNTVAGLILFGGTNTYNLTATITGWTGASGGVLTPDTYSDIVTARIDF